MLNTFICPPVCWEPEQVSLLTITSPNYPSKVFYEAEKTLLSPFFNIDFLSEKTRLPWEANGIVFFSYTSFDEVKFHDLYQQSQTLLANIPELLATVNQFIKHFVPIKSHGRGYDVSLSDPDLPFTVFVSVPGNDEKKNAVARFTESVIHEALHLQLTALEYLSPFLLDKKLENNIYSPWKGERRNARGLLHTVYVFSCLKVFWQRIADLGIFVNRDFALQRVDEITQEMRQAHHLLESPALTSLGKQFAELHLGVLH